MCRVKIIHESHQGSLSEVRATPRVAVTGRNDLVMVDQDERVQLTPNLPDASMDEVHVTRVGVLAFRGPLPNEEHDSKFAGLEHQ